MIWMVYSIWGRAERLEHRQGMGPRHAEDADGGRWEYAKRTGHGTVHLPMSEVGNGAWRKYGGLGRSLLLRCCSHLGVETQPCLFSEHVQGAETP